MEQPPCDPPPRRDHAAEIAANGAEISRTRAELLTINHKLTEMRARDARVLLPLETR